MILELFPDLYSWRLLLGFGAIPAIIIIYLRRGVPESPRWLAQNGRENEAKEVGDRLSPVPVEITPADTARTDAVPEGWRAFVQPQLFKRRLIRRTIFTAVPWFLMDIATYGVGISRRRCWPRSSSSTRPESTSTSSPTRSPPPRAPPHSTSSW